MNVSELIDELEFYTDHGYSDNKVVIQLKEPSVGGVACTGIRQLYAGMDWDKGKIIIQTDDPVIYYKKDRDIPKSAVKIVYTRYPQTRPVIHCPVCGDKLRKNDRFCSRCGQAVSMENLEEIEY